MVDGGARANKRGAALEKYVKDLLIEDYREVPASEFFATRTKTPEQPIFAAEVVVGTSIYAKQRKVDFVIYHPNRWPDCLVIQCKWQTSAGSVEEKYPFEVECIARGDYETIIVLDGGGYSLGAKQWLMEQCGRRKLVDVCSMGEISRLQARSRI